MTNKTEPLYNVMNMSKKTFTLHKRKFSNKNSNFCSTPARYNKTHCTNDIQAFTRQIKFKGHFIDKTFNPGQTTHQNIVYTSAPK